MITRRLQYELAKRVVGPFITSLDQMKSKQKQKRRKPRDTQFGPPLQTIGKLKEIMTRHYLEGRYADGAVPVAWVTSGFPSEILRPFNFHVVYPENHAAVCCARKKVPEISEPCEMQGFSRDLCSYARTDMGNALLNNTPVGRLPKPDLLACCTNICQTVMYWYRWLADYYNVPLVLVDTPFIYGDLKDHHIEYISDQLEELMDVAEHVTKKKIDREVYTKILKLAGEGCQLWGECLEAGQAKPAPWTGFDTFFHIAPIVAIRGSEECNAYYKMLRDELQDRISKGIGGIKNEQYRLLWDNLPMWFNVAEFATMFAERGFNFVCATYSNAWAEAKDIMNPADPFGSCAEAYARVYLNRDIKNRLKTMKELAKAFAVDGAVLHSDRSCKPYSVGQIDVKRKLAEDLGIKSIVLEADHGDQRLYSNEQGETRLQAFMESFSE